AAAADHGIAARADVEAAEARVGAQVGARIPARFGADREIHVVADFPDAVAGAHQALPAARACTSGDVAARHGSKRKLMRGASGRIAVDAPYHHVGVERRKTDEQRASALVLEA